MNLEHRMDPKPLSLLNQSITHRSLSRKSKKYKKFNEDKKKQFLKESNEDLDQKKSDAIKKYKKENGKCLTSIEENIVAKAIHYLKNLKEKDSKKTILIYLPEMRITR